VRDFATDGKVQNIPDVTNRQGARTALSQAMEKALAAQKAKETAAEAPKQAAEAPATPPPVAAEKAAPAAESTVEPADDADSGLEAEDQDLAERAKKRIAKKHRELKQTEALATKLRAELADTEDFSKSQYNRARLAEEKVAELERDLADLRTKAPAEVRVEKGPTKPEVKDFYDEKGQFKLAEYTEAVSAWAAQKAVGDDRAKQDAERKKLEADRAKAAQESAMKLAKERVDAAKTRYSDWDEVMPKSPVQIPDVVAAYIQSSEHIGDIGYYIAKHPEFADSLLKMHPLAAIAEIGRLEIRWQKKANGAASEQPEPPARTQPSAPAPISVLPGSGATGVTTDPSKMTPAQLRDYDRERAVAKKRR
jgi:hypothetical protein